MIILLKVGDFYVIPKSAGGILAKKIKTACSSELGQTVFIIFCGKWGIRTLDTLARIPHFECGSFDHSDNFPFSACKGTTKNAHTQAKRAFF